VKKDRVKTVACLIALVVLVLAVTVSGGTYPKKVPFSYGIVEPDSLRVRVLSRGDASQVGVDTVITTFPDTLVYTLDSANSYEIWKFEQWYSSGTNESPIVEGVPILAVQADVTAISGDATAADNWEAMLDGTRAKLYLSQLNILGASNDTAVIFKAQGDAGIAQFIFGGTGDGKGQYIRGGLTGGTAKTVLAGSGGIAEYITADGGGNAVYWLATNAGHAWQVSATGTGQGQCLNMSSDSSDCIYLQPGGQPNKHGIEIQGGTGSGGDAVRIVATATSANGISMTAADGDGINIDATGGNALELLGDTAMHLNGDVADLVGNITGNLSGSVGSVTGAVGSVTTVNDKTGYSLSTAGIDALLEYDTSLISAGFAQMLKDTSAYQGAAASGVDSGAVSRIVGRKVWGIPAGVGSDSTALADRKAHVESMKNDVVTASVIAASSITASEAPNLDAAITSRSSHSAADVWTATGGDSVLKAIDNKDAFKADVSALALEASLFDPTSDSVIVDVGAAETASGLIPKTEDAVYANRDDYKADVSALALQSEVVNIDGWNPGSDSVLTKTPDAYKADVSGLSTFDASTDSVIVDVSSADDGLIPAIEDTIHANANDYKATGFSTFDNTSDSVIVDVSSADVDLIPAIEDTVHANAADYKADVSALALEVSLFDPTSDSVTLSSAAAEHVADSVLKDSLAFQGATSLTATKISDTVAAKLEADHGAGSWTSGALGTGSDTLIYYTVDTGNDVRVEGVQVSMYTIGGSQVGGPQTTDANGYVLWALNSGDTLLPLAYGPHQYTWGTDTLVFTGQTSDSAMGYRIADPSPPSPDYATIKGFVFSPGGEELFGSIVTAKRIKGEFASDTSGTPYIIGKQPTTAPIDTLGYFSMFLKRTGTYDDTTKGFYNIVGNMSTGPEIFNIIELYVPDTGDVDLGLIVGRREIQR